MVLEGVRVTLRSDKGHLGETGLLSRQSRQDIAREQEIYNINSNIQRFQQRNSDTSPQNEAIEAVRETAV